MQYVRNIVLLSLAALTLSACAQSFPHEQTFWDEINYSELAPHKS